MPQVVDFQEQAVVGFLVMLHFAEFAHDEVDGLAVLLALLFLQGLDESFDVPAGLPVLQDYFWPRDILGVGLFVKLAE